MANVSLVWTKHLKDKEAKDNFERLLRGNVVVNQRLVALLKEKITTSKVSDYDSPSWAYRQADQNGYNRALQDIVELFGFMEK